MFVIISGLVVCLLFLGSEAQSKRGSDGKHWLTVDGWEGECGES